MAYLVQKFDRESKFQFKDRSDMMRTVVWACFANSELGPWSFNCIEYYRRHKERLAYPTQKFVGALQHLYGVLEKALKGRDYLVGPERGRFGVADISCFPFIYHAPITGIDATLPNWPNLKAWVERIKVRPAVRRALTMPISLGWDYDTFLEKMEKDPEFAAQERALKKALLDAQAEYGYEYKSP
jgi:glutathione S-transferase